MISVLLVDDQDLVRMGLRALISGEADMAVAGEAADGIAAVSQARSLRPDVVFMDIRMPGIDGIEATRRIAEDPDLTATRVVVLTTFEHDQYVVDGLRAGASGFLLKNTSPADLVTAIRTVHDGGALLAPSATRTLIREFTAAAPRAPAPHPRIGDLTDREHQVVRLVAQGMSNHEIAEHLVLSPATARTHVSRAMIKLSARDRAQLVVFAYQSGLA
jgi:DNA-binding NarL/FixJ family response regulator